MDVLRAHRSERRVARVGARGPRAGRAPGPTDASAAAIPHQLSGGQQQRVTIAMASSAGRRWSCSTSRPPASTCHAGPHPRPSSAGFAARTGSAMVYVSHDLAVVARIADRIAVMYAGRVVEDGPAAEVISRPAPPVHAGARGGDPRRPPPARAPGHPRRRRRRGRVAARLRVRAPLRVRRRSAASAAVPALEEAVPAHAVRCVRWNELELGRRPGSTPCARRHPRGGGARSSRSSGLRRASTARAAAGTSRSADVSFAVEARHAASPSSASRAAGRRPSPAASPACTCRPPARIVFDGAGAGRRGARADARRSAGASRSSSRTRSSR